VVLAEAEVDKAACSFISRNGTTLLGRVEIKLKLILVNIQSTPKSTLAHRNKNKEKSMPHKISWLVYNPPDKT
jgi:hypothetical protein